MDEEQVLIAGLVTVGLIGGLLISIDNAAVGFVITGISVAIGILGSGVKLGRILNDKTPELNLTEKDRDTVIWGVITIGSFVPFLLTVALKPIILMVGIGILSYGIFKALASDGEIDEDDLATIAIYGIIAMVFGAVYLRPSLLLVIPVLSSIMFVYTLLPETQKTKVRELGAGLTE